MTPDVRDAIARLHAGPWQYGLAVTGGGATAGAWLLSVPGGSRTLLEVNVPYAEQALADYLGRRPATFCSADTAVALARRARERAWHLAPGRPCAGVGCTAALCSDRPKKGEHRIHAAVVTGRRVATAALTLAKGARSREAEEGVAARVVLGLMAEAFGVGSGPEQALEPGEAVERGEAPAGALGAFLAGRGDCLGVGADGRVVPPAGGGGGVGPGVDLPRVLLPGSFNPLHAGHRELARVAGELRGAPAAFELAVVNADKPPLADEEVERRVGQFAGVGPVWLTREPTFAGKARLFPGCVFVLGADTAQRVVQPRFYGPPGRSLEEALGAVRDAGCRFLVGGRLGGGGRFVTLADLEIPGGVRDLFEELPAGAFRADVSSTQLRGAGA